MIKNNLETIIDRNESPLEIEKAINFLRNRNFKVLITGANGSIGLRVQEIFRSNGIVFLPTDIETLDVCSKNETLKVVTKFSPDIILHLAADKHAPEGEKDPKRSLEINIFGTDNVLEAAKKINAVVLLTSTCKACNPETVYGATKLIDERLVLNQGGSVARFHNVVDTSGNVFEIWSKAEIDKKLYVADCQRFFITAAEATSLVINALEKSFTDPGRYIFDPGMPHSMISIVKRLYPKKEYIVLPPRRGDRIKEPLMANQEFVEKSEGRLIKVVSAHDFRI
jgi:FlaA1/EpsC-like NDP-sugar epimerase